MDSEKQVPKTSDELAIERTDLAYERTALASKRTLMAWVRTSASLMSFGFAIYKFLGEMSQINKEQLATRIISPKDVGIILIGFGFFGLLFAMIEYRREIKRLKNENPKSISKSFTPVIAFLMLIFCLILLINALFEI